MAEMSAALRELRASEAMMAHVEHDGYVLPPKVAALAEEHLAILRARVEEEGRMVGDQVRPETSPVQWVGAQYPLNIDRARGDTWDPFTPGWDYVCKGCGGQRFTQAAVGEDGVVPPVHCEDCGMDLHILAEAGGAR